MKLPLDHTGGLLIGVVIINIDQYMDSIRIYINVLDTNYFTGNFGRDINNNEQFFLLKSKTSFYYGVVIFFAFSLSLPFS